MIEDVSSNRSIIHLINIRLISSFFPSLKISGGLNPFSWCSIMNFLFNSSNIVYCIFKNFLKNKLYLNRLMKVDVIWLNLLVLKLIQSFVTGLLPHPVYILDNITSRR